MARTKSSAQWLRRHVADPYVRRARSQGYRSRAAYKLLEIDRVERILRPGATVLDLGAAPGGWSQVAAEKAGRRGRVIAIDCLDIAPIDGVRILRGDVREPGARQALEQVLAGAKADLVLCDLSPDLTGIASTDQARAAELALLAIGFCREYLEASGRLLIKLFQGAEFPALRREIKATFEEVRTVKPAASRAESRETYLLAGGLRGSLPADQRAMRSRNSRGV